MVCWGRYEAVHMTGYINGTSRSASFGGAAICYKMSVDFNIYRRFVTF